MIKKKQILRFEGRSYITMNCLNKIVRKVKKEKCNLVSMLLSLFKEGGGKNLAGKKGGQ